MWDVCFGQPVLCAGTVHLFLACIACLKCSLAASSLLHHNASDAEVTMLIGMYVSYLKPLRLASLTLSSDVSFS